MNSKIQDIISASISVKQQVLADEQLLQVIDAATQACITALRTASINTGVLSGKLLPALRYSKSQRAIFIFAFTLFIAISIATSD